MVDCQIIVTGSIELRKLNQLLNQYKDDVIDAGDFCVKFIEEMTKTRLE